MSDRAKCDIDWRVLEDTLTLAHGTMGLEVTTPTIIVLVHQCLIVVGELLYNQIGFMYLGESFEVILEEHEINPIDYDEVMSNDDAIGAIEAKLESMYSIKVWNLVQAPKRIKLLGASGSTRGKEG